ncbi:glycosyltransferase [Streptomyces sp. NBC_00199]|uniref:glycosyltransferase n=1 Tax=Streptomyces sp. NBC_00199 TaxID=2975678 RepID=UPI00225383CD|nr:glycosyltransferase [Streptomyces sp. NBC_00199]MCX5268136.1 glycosyltransferase [Streptomyces sp. NBC_00199]
MNETNAGGVRQRSVEIVVPVYNEAHVLAESIARLHAHLEESFPFPFRITVADNASTDRTWYAATDLALRLPHVHAVRLEQKGRGRALKQLWNRSAADVVAYMDVDLSTGLEAFLPLVAPRSRTPQLPAARTTAPAPVLPAGATTQLEYAS